MGSIIILDQMKHILIVSFFVLLAQVSSKPSYTDLSDNDFCKYVKSWQDYVEPEKPGFSWSMSQICAESKYVGSVSGLFCGAAGSEWCTSYTSCELSSGNFQAKNGHKFSDYVNCPTGYSASDIICMKN